MAKAASISLFDESLCSGPGRLSLRGMNLHLITDAVELEKRSRDVVDYRALGSSCHPEPGKIRDPPYREISAR